MTGVCPKIDTQDGETSHEMDSLSPQTQPKEAYLLLTDLLLYSDDEEDCVDLTVDDRDDVSCVDLTVDEDAECDNLHREGEDDYVDLTVDDPHNDDDESCMVLTVGDGVGHAVGC